ncbi:hypothetical protein SBM3_00134 [Synechococcus phage S-BM3]|nr:hypothetical protein SBM3_00134 [Synechococcus phage S-BM3]
MDINIKSIDVIGLDIPDITVVDSQQYTSSPIPVAPPVTVNIGLPIVDVPGCVEAHEANNNSKTLGSDDERGLVTYCDSGIPSYNPINFEPEQIIPTAPAGVDTRRPEKPEPPGQVEVPQAAPPTTAKVDCPTPAQEAKEPVGTYVEGFRKKVTEYKLIGNECVQITEAVPIPQQIVAGLPAPGVVTTTATIAVVATASALMAKPLADILLKVIKPTVKKVMKKIAAIRGKSVPVLSVTERRDLQRERTEAIRALKKVLKPKG